MLASKLGFLALLVSIDATPLDNTQLFERQTPDYTNPFAVNGPEPGEDIPINNVTPEPQKSIPPPDPGSGGHISSTELDLLDDVVTINPKDKRSYFGTNWRNNVVVGRGGKWAYLYMPDVITGHPTTIYLNTTNFCHNDILRNWELVNGTVGDYTYVQAYDDVKSSSLAALAASSRRQIGDGLNEQEETLNQCFGSDPNSPTSVGRKLLADAVPVAMPVIPEIPGQPRVPAVPRLGYNQGDFALHILGYGAAAAVGAGFQIAYLNHVNTTGNNKLIAIGTGIALFTGYTFGTAMAHMNDKTIVFKKLDYWLIKMLAFAGKYLVKLYKGIINALWDDQGSGRSPPTVPAAEDLEAGLSAVAHGDLRGSIDDPGVDPGSVVDSVVSSINNELGTASSAVSSLFTANDIQEASENTRFCEFF